MFVSDCLNINEQGHLTIGGCDALELAKEYATPLYVMDETTIRGTLRAFKSAFDEHYDGHGQVLFASKACSFKEMYRILTDEGCGADVVSGGEMYTALQAGMPAERLFFHGNNKSAAELEYAVDAGIGCVVVDNLTELHMLSDIASAKNKTVNIILRICPGVDAHTHDYIRTGQLDSKFGFTLQNGDALAACREAAETAGVCLKGVHCHIGSQIFDSTPFADAAKIMLDFMDTVTKETGVVLTMLNLGGGFGIRYTAKDDPLAERDYVLRTIEALKQHAQTLNYPLPELFIEPGRSIVAPAGITLYTVGNIKTIPDVRTYVSIDGGMADNPRYALYQAEYTAVIADRADQPATETVTIAGRCCESGDLIQEHTPLQSCQTGDTLAVLATGAYCYSMSSNYNRLPRPATVMVKDGESRLVVRRETYDDLIRNDI